MKNRSRLLISLLIISLAAQGGFPGLVLCVGEGGHIAVEIAHDLNCCEEDHASSAATHVHELDMAESHSHDECGPCTDTYISSNLFSRQTQDRVVDVGQDPIAGVAFNNTATQAKPTLLQLPASFDSSLLLIRTTTLLI